MQLAAQAGATVIAVSSGEKRLEKISSLGADHVIDRSSQDLVEAVQDITRGNGVDLVIDPVGATLPSSLAVLSPESRLVFVGNAGGGNLSVDLWPAMQSNQTLHGVFMGRLFERPRIRSTVDALLVALENREIEVRIERVSPFLKPGPPMISRRERSHLAGSSWSRNGAAAGIGTAREWWNS
ncbi:quinone oxidoreductase family protein [Shinella sumterensis]|uniref:quinone oxidoreductase family protein n=1 Tax=Shinella sumterensis TaxID=1967501 RepID=UPI002E766462|nr:zinc-binding dehydrogenase [Shinella sumterensis]